LKRALVLLIGVSTIAFILIDVNLSDAEPYIAVREGFKCSACHINQTGGGKRTRMGTGYATQTLPWQQYDLRGRNIPHYWAFANDLMSIGGDFRIINESAFPKGADTNTFQTEKSTLYLSVQLLPDLLTFYLDESIAPGGAQTRELFGLLQVMHGRMWIKAGKFLQPYGLRIEDDRAFVRQVTGFTFNTPDIGAELGFQGSEWMFTASLTNGSAGTADNNLEKQAVVSAGYIGDAFRIGISGSYNPAVIGSRNTGGAWAGLRIGRAALLGEADFVKDDTSADAEREQLVTHSEMNYLLLRGWNLKAAYEYFDPDLDIDENERDRVLLGLEFFPTPFLHLQLFYRFNQSIPQNIPQNADELALRFHLYF
jgi:hypothetical protein